MIVYVIPLQRYPKTYNKLPLTYTSLASQKNYMSLYLMDVYADREAEARFRAGYVARGRKPTMGKSCVNFKKLDDLPLDLVGEAIARTPVTAYIKRYEESRKK